MSSNAYSAYQAADVLTADPVTITTMLFDGAVKAMRKARIHDENKNRKGFLDEVDRASLIVGELLSTLDMSHGEIPRNLSAIYTYCLRCLVECTLGDMKQLDEAEKHIARIGSAWKTATAELRAAGAPTPASANAAA